MTAAAIEVDGLGFRYGTSAALTDVSFAVGAGRVLGLLGHNGAGKTTLVRILTTLLAPTSGSAAVAGYDVRRAAHDVRSRIALAGQYAAIDDLLTGRQNLELIGRLNHLGGREARRRAAELIDEFDLADAGDRRLRTYSGGMQRRLDLAACLVARPEVLFLDEPTTGLDPISRGNLWERIRRLVDQGTTVLLTTQYLEEAERLADSIIVLNGGRPVMEGTPDELKRSIGLDRLVVEVERPEDSETVRALLSSVTGSAASSGEDRIEIVAETRSPLEDLAALSAALVRGGVEVRELGVRSPTLDEVFIAVA